MDVFLIRTRLEALIVGEILAQNPAAPRPALAFLYQSSKTEDAPDVYRVYRTLSARAAVAVHVVIGESGIKATTRLLLLYLLAWTSGGTVRLGVINNYAAALAARFIPGLRIETFDDGSVNINPGSIFFDESPLQGDGLKRQLMRLLFPRGCAAWFRRRTRRHYTIFPGLPNIVEPQKVATVPWSWEAHLFEEDLAQLPDASRPLKVVIGTTHHNRPAPEASMRVARALIAECDLYIMHPRERPWVEGSNVVRLGSPAEAILLQLCQSAPLEVFHFGTTVACALQNESRIRFQEVTVPA